MFARIISFILNEEGGYVNHPDDPGGATNMGITQKTLDAYCEKHKLPKMDVRHLKTAQAVNIYYDEYWNPDWEKLGFPLAACMMDTAVNMGVPRAYQFLKESNGNYVHFLQLRVMFYNRLVERRPRMKVFHKGWMNRITRLRRFIESEMQEDAKWEKKT